MASTGWATKMRSGFLDYSKQQSRSQPRPKYLPNELARKPEERLLEVVIGFCRDLAVLNVMLPVEGDRAGLHFTLLHISKLFNKVKRTKTGSETDFDIDLVPAEDDGDVLADAHKVAVPVGHILVRDPRRNVEHDDRALALHIVPIAQATKLLLPGGVPGVKADDAVVGPESERVHLDSESGWNGRGEIVD